QQGGISVPINLPAIPIDVVAGTNAVIPITGQIDPITIHIPQFGIPVNMGVQFILTINFTGTQQGPVLPPIVVNPIVLKDLAVGVNVQVPFQMNAPGQLNLTLPGMLGIGNSSVSSGFFNGNSSGTSGFFNSSDLSSGFANANGALTSGW
ncbi:hypothetical protein BST16_28025, partial [Mycobacterium asiaticum DSM 44297]